MTAYMESSHPQGSEEWLKDRAGKITGSRIGEALKTIEDGSWSKRRLDYAIDLAIEIITGIPKESYTSREMQWGKDHEPFARMAYEAKTGNIVTEHGFFYLPDFPAGCSVDGLFTENGKKGVLEAKCPKTTTHVKYIINGEVPEEYRHQCLHNIWVAEADFADFVSYDPRMPKGLELYICRFTPTPQELARHERQVREFEQEVQDAVAKILKLKENTVKVPEPDFSDFF